VSNTNIFQLKKKGRYRIILSMRKYVLLVRPNNRSPASPTAGLMLFYREGGGMKKHKCDCHLHRNQVCDICQKVTGKERDRIIRYEKEALAIRKKALEKIK
jgi:hypothetical protein